jgi:hypothetical protein
MKLNLIGPFVVNAPFGTEIAFAKGLREAGHEVNEVDPNVTTDCPNEADVTVVFKSCVGNEDIMLRRLDHPIVVYQPDDARFPHIREMILKMRRYADLFLSFDDHGATVARSLGYRAAETLLLTADPDLYSPSPSPIERDIDVSFIGSIGSPTAHASRLRMINQAKIVAQEFGWKTHFEVSQDIPHVVDIYRRSKVVLNHATDVGQPFGTGFGLQCRHFEVGLTKTCLLSNKLLSWDPSIPRPTFCQFAGEDFVDRLVEVVTSKVDGIPYYQSAGENLYNDILQGHMPVDRARQLVDFIERNA